MMILFGTAITSSFFESATACNRSSTAVSNDANMNVDVFIFRIPKLVIPCKFPRMSSNLRVTTHAVHLWAFHVPTWCLKFRAWWLPCQLRFQVYSVRQSPREPWYVPCNHETSHIIAFTQQVATSVVSLTNHCSSKLRKPSTETLGSCSFSDWSR